MSDTFAFYSNLVLEEDRQAFLEAVRMDSIIRNTENRLIYSVPFRWVFDSGIRYYRAEFARLALEDDFSNIVLGFRDVDEEVRKEQQIQQALREAIAAANASNMVKTSFLSDMSHEIRTPMNAIIGLDNIALNDPDLTPHIMDHVDRAFGKLFCVLLVHIAAVGIDNIVLSVQQANKLLIVIDRCPICKWAEDQAHCQTGFG